MFDLLRLWSGLLHRFLRSRQSLLIENLALRQQLAVLKRQHSRPRLTPSERCHSEPADQSEAGEEPFDKTQLRDAIPSDHPYQFLIHDRDTIFSSELDAEVQRTFGLRVLLTPVRAPQANAYCERLMGTVRRECLDFMIPLERQFRGTLRSWVAHYNKGRPHSSLGPGTPEPTPTQPLSQPHPRHRLPRDCRITVEDILGGLHHEYQPEKCVA